MKEIAEWLKKLGLSARALTVAATNKPICENPVFHSVTSIDGCFAARPDFPATNLPTSNEWPRSSSVNQAGRRSTMLMDVNV
jgi:hypothetical protein